MDAHRYERIQKLFWETEELPPEQWEGHLRSINGEDRDIVEDVRSLLEEHDNKAALTEGDQVRSTKIPLPPRRSSQETMPSSQRTHAVPRHPAGPKPKLQKPAESLTSIGPASNSPSWWRTWAWTNVAMLLAIWTAATIAGLRDQQRNATRSGSRNLAIVEQISERVQSVLEQQRRSAILVGQSAPIRDLILKSRETETTDAIDQLDTLISQQLSLAAGSTSKPLQLCDYSIWDPTRTLFFTRQASSAVAMTRVGSTVAAESSAVVTRAFNGQVQLLGPTLAQRVFEEPTSEVATNQEQVPMVGWVVPISDPPLGRGADAVILLGQCDLYQKLNDVLMTASRRYDVDAFLVNGDGIMLTHSPIAAELVGGPVSCSFRVADRVQKDSSFSVAPLTVAAAAVQVSEGPQIRSTPYESYTGQTVFGGWRWLNAYQLGVIVEQPVPSNWTPWSTTWPWATLLTFSMVAITAAGFRRLANETPKASSARQPLGRYKILEELGSGGMGMVYRAHHVELGRDIAIKILRNDRQDEDDRQRFDREARLAATLTSPHSVTVYDYGRGADGDMFCVMQLLKGLTFYEVVTRSGPQPIGRVVWLLRQVCQSIREAHSRGLMHRDLKPQNVMLDFDSLVGDWAVVFDFGLAKPLEPDPGMFQTADTIWAGTPMYMSPERFREPSVMDPRSDIYSIGCVAYFLLAGHPPFSECDPQSMFALILSESPISLSVHRGSAVAADVETIVSRCMAKNKADRYASIEGLIDDLDQLTVEHPWSLDDARSWWQTHAPELTSIRSPQSEEQR